ncbi:uncharacterized protein EV420DRAFT_1473288 [Desarmillaria tabescens]|uniref:Uncharacterized protein n=1 Tax=Armillaria tabescens TaxID=1929756 RepID=A0AA39NQX2_ARMTA|nr:uncharacterized protein EV420DRAFT_1473288 [Desarmillaria tabescens]KAK0470207.1 hypothetical protein EV420DRAFT_1473288 [Desarmillaria tabescens]
MNPQSDTSLPSDSAQACRSPPSQKTTTSSHSKTWKGKMAAGAKKIGLPFRKKAPDETASLQTMETILESSYMYEKPEGSTLMSLEEEFLLTKAMKYASQVQHQKPLKESGYDQMLGTMWEEAAAAQIVQTPEVTGQQMSIASSPGESPSWREAAQQQKERRVLFTDINEEDTVLWWFTGAQSLTGTTNISNPVETELDQANHDLEPFLNPKPTFYVKPPFISQRELQWWVYDREDFKQIFEEYRRYGSTEIPISYDTNPFFTQPTISTDWTCGLEPRYKSTGSPVWEHMQTTHPSLMTPMKKVTSSSRDPVGDPTDEELYRMNWDQFWWHMHAKLPYETYWSTTPQGLAYQKAEPGSQLERDILLQETKYIAINYWNILHPDQQLLQGGHYEIPSTEDLESEFSNLGILQTTTITRPAWEALQQPLSLAQGAGQHPLHLEVEVEDQAEAEAVMNL